MERRSISSTENPQGLYRRPAIGFPRELPKVFCPQISLQSVYLMTPSNGVVEGEGAQIRLWPSGPLYGSNPRWAPVRISTQKSTCGKRSSRLPPILGGLRRNGSNALVRDVRLRSSKKI